MTPPRMTQLRDARVLLSKPKISRSHIKRAIAKKQHGITVQFMLSVADAQSVCVAGTFNGWDPSKTPLRREGADWVAAISLPRGVYEYRFIVDGVWMNDPGAATSAPNPFGGVNSVLTI